MTIRNTMIWLVVAAAAIAVMLGILAVLELDGIPGTIIAQLAGSSVAIFVACVLAFLCCLVLDKNILSVLMWIGITTNWLSALLWLFLIWSGDEFFSREFTWNYVRVSGVVSSVAVWSTYVGLIFLLPIRRHSLSLWRTTTLSMATLFAALIVIALVIDLENLSSKVAEIFGKALWILFFLSFGLTVVTVVLTFVNRAKEKNTREAMSDRFQVEVVCPRCDTTNTLNNGIGKCSSCSLRIRIEVEEPRCICGYSIYRLAADRCPECGNSIAAEDRWLPSGAAPEDAPSV